MANNCRQSPPSSAALTEEPGELLDTAAFLCSNWGLSLGDVTLTTILTSMFSAVTVLLAAIFLRERVAPWQWVGVAILLIGIPLTQL